MARRPNPETAGIQIGRGRWTHDEEATLASLFPLASWPELFRSLPGKTYWAIQRRAQLFGIKRIRSTKIERIATDRISALSREDLAYIAGLFDGEGCVFLTKRYVRRAIALRINVTNTDETIIRWLFEKTAIGIVGSDPRKRHGRWKPVWWWTIGRSDHATKFLSAIRPFLKIKHKQADLALSANVFEEKHLLAIRCLNARGSASHMPGTSKDPAPRVSESMRRTAGMSEPM